MTDNDSRDLSRRSVLRATAGASTGLALVGTASAGGGHGGDDGDEKCHYETASMGHHDADTGIPGSGEHNDPLQRVLCPDHPHAKTPPGHTMKHFPEAAVGGCPDGTGLGEDCTTEQWPDCTSWPEPTKELIKDSREALTTVYDNVGTLIAEGYVPYFDVLVPGGASRVSDFTGVSHWFNPDYLNNTDPAPDPLRPESIMLENKYWSPIGPMFIGTNEGDIQYGVDDLWGYESTADEDGSRAVWHLGYEGDRTLKRPPCGECYPMHAHDGMPARIMWWLYRQAFEQDFTSGELEDVTLHCFSPPMMHAWIFPTEAGPHSPTSGAPTEGYEVGRLPNTPGFETPAVPGEDDLTFDVLPEAVQERAMPDRLRAELGIVADLPESTLQETSIAELERMMDRRLGPADDEATDVRSHLQDLL